MVRQTNRKAVQWRNAYKILETIPRSIVDVLAVIFESTARTNIILSLNRQKIRDPKGKNFNTKNLEPFLDMLKSSGWIEKNSVIECKTPLSDIVCRILVEEGRFDTVAETVQKVFPFRQVYYGEKKAYPRDYEHLVREIRIGVYRGDAQYIKTLFREYGDAFADAIQDFPPYGLIFENGFDPDWFSSRLPPEIIADILIEMLKESSIYLNPPPPDGFSLLRDQLDELNDESIRRSARIALAEQLILSGYPQDAVHMVSDIETHEAYGVKGIAAFLAGENDTALAHFETAMKLYKKTTRKRKVFLDGPAGLFYILALIKSGDLKNIQIAKGYVAIAENEPRNLYRNVYFRLKNLIMYQAGDTDALQKITSWREFSHNIPALILFLNILCIFWVDPKAAAKRKNKLWDLHKKAERNGYFWPAAETAALLSQLPGGDADCGRKAAAFQKSTGVQSIVNLIRKEEKWKKALDALINIQKEKSVSTKDTGKKTRMVWLFSLETKYGNWEVSPREQVINAKGVWSKGRRVALKRLYHEQDTFNYLTPQDLDVIRCIEMESSRNWGGYTEVDYYFSDRVITALAGHPLVFWEDSPTVPVEIVKGEPELVVEKKRNGKYEIAFPNTFNHNQDLQVVRESPTRVKVIETSEETQRIIKIIGKGLSVPAKAKDQVLQMVNSISSILTVHSGLAETVEDAETVTADPTPHLHLLPFGRGLKIELLARPFSNAGPCFQPGAGVQTVISDIEGKRLQTRRNLAAEKKAAESVIASCSTLRILSEIDDASGEWILEDPEDCLSFLVELQEIKDNVIVEWPEGEHFKINQQADMNRFFIQVKKENDWFAVSGELRLDNDLVLSLQELMKLLEDTPGRFVRLKDGQFLALTEAFRKRLDELRAWSEKSGNSLKFHPLAALPIEDLENDLGGLKGDKHWKAHLKRLKSAQKLEPEIPTTFKAELRDYQAEGFRWMARLAHWGAGACLADDMGLGKTIQALAVLVSKAAQGPSLIVAPTSVAMNWETEARRFAPTLNIVTFTNGDRKKLTTELKPFDVLLITYGLLQQEKTAELLSDVHFQTIVLDEAQAIKNFTTKRSQGAMNLNGDFKLITTGTPIENHLGELWNLFRFINPGLLGTHPLFNERFAAPIEKHQDKNARRRLKKLIQPFILRRTKNQVLDELPPRTDILLQVELSDEEMAFYEALRRQALEKLNSDDGPAGPKHLKILAEIMKLRRACCNPRLVMPDAGIPSAKLSVFADVVDELLENRHKALVFSQFTGHLKIIRDLVEKKGVAYQYLDGQTSQKERKKRVDAFQSGQGDLFLISLKAGGLGLNLTAADYVIHMDPWWNPAVEDQAADRAHRIGQKRPVTVYRLVARHTIEEKITALHNTKRDLADSLLEGADITGKMSADELLKLMIDNPV